MCVESPVDRRDLLQEGLALSRIQHAKDLARLERHAWRRLQRDAEASDAAEVEQVNRARIRFVSARQVGILQAQRQDLTAEQFLPVNVIGLRRVERGESGWLADQREGLHIDRGRRSHILEGHAGAVAVAGCRPADRKLVVEVAV